MFVNIKALEDYAFVYDFAIFHTLKGPFIMYASAVVDTLTFCWREQNPVDSQSTCQDICHYY